MDHTTNVWTLYTGFECHTVPRQNSASDSIDVTKAGKPFGYDSCLHIRICLADDSRHQYSILRLKQDVPAIVTGDESVGDQANNGHIKHFITRKGRRPNRYQLRQLAGTAPKHATGLLRSTRTPGVHQDKTVDVVGKRFRRPAYSDRGGRGGVPTASCSNSKEHAMSQPS